MRDKSSNLAHEPSEPEVARHSAQVLRFRPPTRLSERRYSNSSCVGKEPDDHESQLLDDLARYEQGIEDQPINYRQRMLMNVISVAIVTVILGVGVCIANNLS
jgi:hypothetical protein